MAKSKLPIAKFPGEVDLNGFKISCAVLEDGTRVFSERSLAQAFGIKGGGAYWQKKKEGGAVLPEYLSARYLNPYISDELREKLDSAVVYTSKSGVEARGVDVTVLADICDVYVTAKNNGVKNENFLKVADNAYQMLKSFAKVGIIAIVDEATGYQYEREKDELQKILKAYISPELLPWQKKFPDIFYKELFRLNGWDFTVNGIKKRPGVIGTWTKKLVYEQLPNGVLDELRKKTPKSQSGNYTKRFFQSLTPETGDPHLTAQLNQIITLFQLSDNMEHMWSQFEKLRIRQAGQLELPFQFDEQGHTKEPNAPIYTEEKLSSFNKNLKRAIEYKPKE